MGDNFLLDMAELNSFAADLSAAGKEALPLARLAVQKSSADIKTDAQAFAPVDTGTLRSSIGYTTKQLTTAVEGEIGATAEYAGHVEWGTSQMAPRAFLGPAFDRHSGEFEEAISAIVSKLL